MSKAATNNSNDYDSDKPREEIDHIRFYPDLDVKDVLDTYIIYDNEEILESEENIDGSSCSSMIKSDKFKLSNQEIFKLESYFQNKRKLIISVDSKVENLTRLKRKKQKNSDSQLQQRRYFEKLHNTYVIDHIYKNDGIYSKFGYRQDGKHINSDHNNYPNELYIRNIPHNDFAIFDNKSVNQFNRFFQSLYDMDEQDIHFLKILMKQSKNPKSKIDMPLFEIIFTFLERQVYLLSKSIMNEQLLQQSLKPHKDEQEFDYDDQPCEICNRYESDPQNSIIFCDSCNLAVHQECYGVIFIPEGHWYCRRCLNDTKNLNCEFCPSKNGAFKQLNNGNWAHLLCGIFIPELSLKSTIYMETIEGAERIPKSRWRLTCFICKLKTNNGKGRSACVQCSNKNCFTSYHITCAKMANLKIEFLNNDGKKGIVNSLNNKQENLKSYCDKHSIENENLDNSFDHDSNLQFNKYSKNIVKVRKFYNPDKRFKKNQQLLSDNDINDNHDNNCIEEFDSNVTLSDENLLDIDMKNDSNNYSTYSYIAKDLLFRWQLSNKDNRGFVLPWKIFHDLQIFMIDVFDYGVEKEAQETLLKVCKYWNLKKQKKIKLINFSNDNTEFNNNNNELNHIFFNNLLSNDIKKIISITKIVKRRQEKSREKFENYCEIENLRRELRKITKEE